MIIKNVSPHIHDFTSLNIRLMPGDQVDISHIDYQRQKNCFELQEAFKRGDLVCLGVTQVGSVGSLDSAKNRILREGAQQKLLTIEATDPALRHRTDNTEEERYRKEIFPTRISVEEEIAAENGEQQVKVDNAPPKEEEKNFNYKYRDSKPDVKVVENPTDKFVFQDRNGNVYMKPFPKPKVKKPSHEEEEVIREKVSITKEKAREILAKRCCGITSSNRQCGKLVLPGYEYCAWHLPPDLQKEYNEKKKQQFFKDDAAQ
jgi:hypothetical protein